MEMPMPRASRQVMPASPRGRPTAARATAIAEAVCDAALAIFVEEGFDAATMELIAARAGVSKPTVYSRFSGKDDLFAAVMRRQMDRLAGFTAARRAGGFANLSAMLRFEAQVLVEVLRQPDYRALDRLLQSVSFHFPELAAEWESAALGQFAERLANDMREIAERTGVQRRTPQEWHHIAQMLIHAIGSWFHVQSLGREVPDAEAQAFVDTAIAAIVSWASFSGEE